MQDFGLNLSPVLEIRSPASTNAGEDAMPKDEALERPVPASATGKPACTLFMHYHVRIDDAERLAFEHAGQPIPDAVSYEGTLQVYRALPVEVTELLPMLISKYSGTNNDEGLRRGSCASFRRPGLWPPTRTPFSHIRPSGPARSVARQSADASGAHILRGKPSRGRGRRQPPIRNSPATTSEPTPPARARKKRPGIGSGGGLFVVLNQPGQASLRLVGLPFRGPG